MPHLVTSEISVRLYGRRSNDLTSFHWVIIHTPGYITYLSNIGSWIAFKSSILNFQADEQILLET